MKFLVTVASGLCAQLDIKGADIGPTKNQEVDSDSRNVTLIVVTFFGTKKMNKKTIQGNLGNLQG